MRHGFLILMHRNYDQVIKLISFLDRENNYIFLHVDKKSSLSEIEAERLRNAASHSKVMLVDRVSVQWGGYSLIEATMNLFKEAVKYHLDYYHLISGADMMLVSMDRFEAFFEQHRGYQFVSYSPEKYRDKLQKRVRYFWLFQERIGNPRCVIKERKILRFILLLLQRALVGIQMVVRIDRRNKKILYTVGPEWASVTDEFVRFIISKEKWIKKTFRFTICSDELLICTLLSNSRLSDKVLPNMRYIDWKRGNPYVFRLQDRDELMSSGKLFARKFDQTIDCGIIDSIYKGLGGFAS